MAVYKKVEFTPGPPKRTRIGGGKRVRTRLNQGRTKRSSPQKLYRGQGKG